MSALRQPDFDDYYYAQPQANPVVNQPQIAKPQVKKSQVVKSKNFRSANNLPKNLKILSQIQKGSFAIAIATMTASIGLYASTVQIPKLWSQEYQHLEDLQLQERQLVAINETIKYQIAQEAGQDSRLSITKPESAIFISPAKVKARKSPSSNPAQEKTVELKHTNSGY